MLVRREGEVSLPVNDLAVGVVRLLGTEWGPTDQALEHDGSNTPPVTSLVVTLATENLRSNVIRRTDSGVGELPTRLAPGVDLVAVRYCQLNLIDTNGVPIRADGLRAVVLHEVLVV